jgi:hypothetical protein
MRGLFEYLLPFLSRVYVGHRSVSTAVIAQFVNHAQVWRNRFAMNELLLVVLK